MMVELLDVGSTRGGLASNERHRLGGIKSAQSVASHWESTVQATQVSLGQDGPGAWTRPRAVAAANAAAP